MFGKKSNKDKVLGSQPSAPVSTLEADETYEERSAEATAPKPKKHKSKGEKKPFQWQVLLHNKKLVGCICIGAAAIIAFVLTPLIQRISASPRYIVSASQDIALGEAYTQDNLELVAYTGTDVPKGAFYEIDSLVGKFANVNLLSGDIVTDRKASMEYPSDDNYLAALPTDKLAISITAKTASSSLSHKLRSGDIISIYTITEIDGEYSALCPPELQSVEVLAVTNGDTQDIQNGTEMEDSQDRQISTITCIVNNRQAELLALADNHGEIHVALKQRGNPGYKKQLLAEQDTFFIEELENEAPEDIQAEEPAPTVEEEITDEATD